MAAEKNEPVFPRIYNILHQSGTPTISDKEIRVFVHSVDPSLDLKDSGRNHWRTQFDKRTELQKKGKT